MVQEHNLNSHLLAHWSRKQGYLWLTLISSLGLWTLFADASEEHPESHLSYPNESILSSTREDHLDDEVVPIESTNSTQNCSLSLEEFVIYFYIQTFICFVGFVLNLINLSVFLKPQFSGAAYTYMTALSLADALTLLNYMPVGLLRCKGYFPYCQNPSFKAFRTVVFYYNAYVTFAVNNMSEAASAWFTVLLSIERYTAMRNLGIDFHIKQKRSRPECREEKADSCVQTYGVRIKEQTDSGNQYSTQNSSTVSSSRRNLRNLLNRMKCASCHNRNPCCHPRMTIPFRKLDVRYSIIAVTVLSIILNVPFFFAQAVKVVGYANEPMENIIEKNSTLDIYSNFTSSAVTTDQPKPSVKRRIEMTQFGKSELYKAFTWFKIILVQILPLVFLCIANFRLFQFIHIAGHRRQQVLSGKPATSFDRTKRPSYKRKLVGKHKQNLRKPMVNGGSSSRWQTAQRKLTVLLIVIVALFIAGQIPQSFAYVELYNAFIRPLHSSCSPLYCCRPYQIYRAVANITCLITYAVNFFVYLILNKHFRRQLRAWFKPLCPCCIQSKLRLPHRSRTSIFSTQNPIRRDSRTMPANLFLDSLFSRSGRGCELLSYRMDTLTEAASAPVTYELQTNHLAPQQQVAGGTGRQCSRWIRTLRQTFYSGLSPRINKQYQTKAPSNAKSESKPTQYQKEQRVQHRNYLTEIQFSSDRKPFISKSYRTCYSHDSIVKNVVVERDLCMYYAAYTGIHPVRSSITPKNRNEHLYAYHLPVDRSARTDTHSVTGATIHSSSQIGLGPNNDAWENLHTQSLLSHPIPTDSYSSCSHLFSPIAYQESDFDVISVDECFNEHKSHHDAE